MLDKLAHFAGVSPFIGAIVLALGVVQIVTQVYALIDLVRRDEVEGGRKWVWAVAVLVGGLIGSLAYLAVGRPPAKVDTPRVGGASTSGDDAARRAVDVLYNPPDSR